MDLSKEQQYNLDQKSLEEFEKTVTLLPEETRAKIFFLGFNNVSFYEQREKRFNPVTCLSNIVKVTPNLTAMSFLNSDIAKNSSLADCFMELTFVRQHRSKLVLLANSKCEQKYYGVSNKTKHAKKFLLILFANGLATKKDKENNFFVHFASNEIFDLNLFRIIFAFIGKLEVQDKSKITYWPKDKEGEAYQFEQSQMIVIEGDVKQIDKMQKPLLKDLMAEKLEKNKKVQTK